MNEDGEEDDEGEEEDEAGEVIQEWFKLKTNEFN